MFIISVSVGQESDRQLSWLPLAQGLTRLQSRCQGCRHLRLDGLEDLLPSSFLWLLVTNLSSLLHRHFFKTAHNGQLASQRASDEKEKGRRKRKGKTQKSTKTEDVVFCNLISEVGHTITSEYSIGHTDQPKCNVEGTAQGSEQQKVEIPESHWESGCHSA